MTYPVFSAGEVLGAADMNAVGLWLLNSKTFTSAAAQNTELVFSSNYQNYCVVITAGANNAGNVYFQMLSGTNTVESGAVYDRRGFGYTSSIFDLNAANQTDAYIGPINNVTNSTSSGVIHFFRPNEANHTMVNTHMQSDNGTITFTSYRIETTTAYTGLKFFPAAGATAFTGTVRVYGYRN